MKTKSLSRLLAHETRRYLGLVGLWSTARLAILAGGLLLRELFDRLTGSAPAGLTIVSLIALVLAAELGKVQLWYGIIMGRVEASYTYGIRARLRARVFGDLLARPSGVALPKPVGDVLSRLGGDTNEVGVFAIWSASNVARLIIALGAIGIMCTVSPLVTLGVIVPILIVIVLGRALNGRLGRYREAAREAAGEVSTAVGEAIAAAQTIKVARAEGRIVERLRRTNRLRAKVTVREQVFGTVQEALFENAAVLGTGLLLLLAAGRMRSGEFTVGDLALFIFYLGFLSEAVWALGMFFVRVKKASLSLGRLAELTDRPSEPGSVVLGDELRVTGLTYRYPGGENGIEDISLTFPKGSLTVITGRVGSGKSTLVRTMLGILPADAGHVVRPQSFAYTRQAPTLFSGTVRENIELGLEPEDERLAGVVSDSMLAPDVETFGEGLDTVLGARGQRLSGGQLKRVAAARMLLRDPELLVFDDLSSGLDHATELQLWEGVLTDRRRTVVAVSHSRDILRRADQVVVLESGRVSARGTFADLCARSPELRALWSDAEDPGVLVP